MDTLKKKIKHRYILFVSAAILLFVFIFFIVERHVTIQKDDAFIINKSGKQRMLSQNIVKQVLAYNDDLSLIGVKKNDSIIKALTKEFKTSHNYLKENYKPTEINTLDSLFLVVDREINKILNLSNAIAKSNDVIIPKKEIKLLIDAEYNFLNAMDAIVLEYQKVAELNIKKLQNSFYKLITITILLLTLGFFYLLVPTVKSLIKKNESLQASNKALEKSKEEIRKNLIELKQLKEDIENKDRYNRIFIEQAAPSIAMLDNDMKYIAVSEKWKKDYKKEGQDIIGKSHYEVFPEIGDDWKAQHQKCLNGYIDKCDEAPFVREDGTTQWIYWDVRPWYKEDNTIGGLLMHTGDITKIKEQALAKHRIEQILKRTSSVARIGTWELDVKTDVLTFSDISKQLLKLPKDFSIEGKKSLYLYKDGVSRIKIIDAISKLKKTGKPFDIELEVITGDGETIWIRDIGQAEFLDGKCVKAYGVFQDINHIKKAAEELNRKNELLNFGEKINKIGNWHWLFKENKIKCSSGLYEILDREQKEELLSIEKFVSYTHPDDVDSLQLSIETIIKNKKFNEELVHRIISESGHIKTLKVLGKVFTDDKGDIIEIIGATQDITSQKMAENKFKGLLESAPDAMIILNNKKRVHLINKQAERLFGYKAEELKGERIETLLPERIVENFKIYRDAYFADPKSIAMGENRELIGLNKEGKEFPVQVSLSPLETDEGLLVSSAIRDITKQKQVEQNIRNSKEHLELLAKKLKTKNIQLADFAHITSHNLRAPVSNLNSLIDMYYLSQDEKEKEEVFDKFKTVITHLTDTLNTLVDALKVKKEKVSIETVYFDTTLNKTKELLIAQITDTKAEITSDFTEINKISYNKIYFESIFLNLVENAIKYKSKNRAPKIHLSTKKVDGTIVFEVQDNGLGINLARHKHKLFGLNKVFHRHPDAKGVGLFMTKLQIESLGGEITIDSEVDKGSKFIIKFNKQP